MGESKKGVSTLKVAIIGGGPAGLSAAIELAKLPYVDWKLYEQKPNISEISTGITLQPNTWRFLEKWGASKHLRTTDFFRPADGHDTEYRDGRSGIIVKRAYPEANVPSHHAPCRIHRVKLQQVLLKEADQSRIRTGKKLIHAARTEAGAVRIVFKDGFADEVDLLIGADGIRSVVREFAFPEYKIGYSGSTAYRTVVRADDAEQINGLVKSITFWYGTDGKWVYTCPLGGNDWEVTCRIREPDDGDRSSWGRDVSISKFVESFHEFCEPVQQLLKLATKVKRFDYFGGPRLPTVINHDSVALIGDASHPLSGAFGAGAAFAFEDSHVLARAIQWATSSGRGLARGLSMFDEVRSRHYRELYRTLDEIADDIKRDPRTTSTAQDNIICQIEKVSLPKHAWMYHHKADDALNSAIKLVESLPAKPSSKL